MTTAMTPTWSAKLLELGRRSGDIPIYGSDEWHALPSTDPRRFAAVVRAAEAWRREGEPGAIRDRLRAELADNDRLCAWRLRQMSHDLSELPWTRIREVDRARRQAGDARYRPPEAA